MLKGGAGAYPDRSAEAVGVQNLQCALFMQAQHPACVDCAHGATCAQGIAREQLGWGFNGTGGGATVVAPKTVHASSLRELCPFHNGQGTVADGNIHFWKNQMAH